jgi:hypothetical protein
LIVNVGPDFVGPHPTPREIDMAKSPTSKSPHRNANKVQPDGKIVVASVVSHSSLLAAISERNPIIASRTKSSDDDDES